MRLKLIKTSIAIAVLALVSPAFAVTGMGTGNSVSGPAGTIVFGDYNTNSGQPSAIFGSNNQDVSAGGAAIIGNGNVVGGTATGFNFVTGNNNNVQSGGMSSVNGSGNTVGLTATDARVLGNNNNVTGANSNTVGSGNTTSGANTTVIGSGSVASGADSGVLGNGSAANGAGSYAIGNGATATNANDVALGSGSSTAAAVATANTTINGTSYSFAGTAPTSTVSVGAVGAERTITNVAAGRISATSTDAVNGSQLHATNTALAVTDARVTAVDNRVTNIAGDTSTTYTDVNGLGIRYARTNEAGLPAIDSYATGKGSTAVGYGAKSQGENSLALGNGATATNAGDVALGAGSTTAAAVATTSTVINGDTYAFAGTAPVSTLSVGAVGAERTITNVAAGRLSATSTDAVNGSQLNATNTALGKLSDRAVKYDLNPDGTVNYTHTTMAGPVSTDGGVTGGTTISNIHQGAVNATSTDAINGAQLYNIAGDTSNTYVTTNGRGIRYARTNDAVLPESDAFAQGKGSTALGYGATTTTNATNAVALGNGATASYAGAVAIGSGSVASGPGVNVSGTVINGQTYTFAGQNASSQGVVSVGSVGAERQVTNVAAGQLTATSTDAVNGSQLFASNKAIEALDGKTTQIDARVTVLDRTVLKYDIRGDGTVNYNSVTLGGADGNTGPVRLKNVADGRAPNDMVNFGQLGVLDKSSSSGIAAALATAAMPQALDASKTMVAAGIGVYNNQVALSVGASTVSDNERSTLKGAISAGSSGNVGVNLTFGYHF